MTAGRTARGAALAVAVAVLSFSLAAPAALAQEGSLRFLGESAVVLQPGGHGKATLLVAGATADDPVDVSVIAVDAATGTAVTGLAVRCTGGDGRGTPSSPLVCPARVPVLVVELLAADDAGPLIATLVALDGGAGSQATGTLTIEDPDAPAPPTLPAPAAIEFTVESVTGPGSGTYEVDAPFTVVGAPLTAMASGASDEADIELDVDGDQPQISVDDLDRYGDLTASFDVNGPADGGVVDLLVHHRRPGWVAVALLLGGASAASALAFAHRHRQRGETEDRYRKDRSHGKGAEAALFAAAESADGLDVKGLRAAWWFDDHVRDLPADRPLTTASVEAHRAEVDRYVDCTDAGRSLLATYASFVAGGGASWAIVGAIRSKLQAGPGADLADGAVQLETAARTASEGRRLEEVLTERIAAGGGQTLSRVRDDLRSMADLSDRKALDAVWTALSSPPPADLPASASFASEGRRGLRRELSRSLHGALSAVVPLPGATPVTVHAPSTAVVVRGAASTVVRAFSSRAAWWVALAAGFLIALAIDMGETFGSDESWGTGWDMIATFGRAFTVTGVFQVARNLGATAAAPAS